MTTLTSTPYGNATTIPSTSYGNLSMAGLNYVTASGSMTSTANWNGQPPTKLTVSGDTITGGDIIWQGRSLGKLLEKIEDRLCILQEPSKDKLEKFEALRLAYDHYKLLEKLVTED